MCNYVSRKLVVNQMVDLRCHLVANLRLPESVVVNAKLIYDQFTTNPISSKITSKLRRTLP